MIKFLMSGIEFWHFYTRILDQEYLLTKGQDLLFLEKDTKVFQNGFTVQAPVVDVSHRTGQCPVSVSVCQEEILGWTRLEFLTTDYEY